MEQPLRVISNGREKKIGEKEGAFEGLMYGKEAMEMVVESLVFFSPKFYFGEDVMEGMYYSLVCCDLFVVCFVVCCLFIFWIFTTHFFW